MRPRSLVPALTLVFAAACGKPSEAPSGASFVAAANPHLVAGSGVADSVAAAGNRDALAVLLRSLRGGRGSPMPDFVVLTGDLGPLPPALAPASDTTKSRPSGANDTLSRDTTGRPAGNQPAPTGSAGSTTGAGAQGSTPAGTQGSLRTDAAALLGPVLASSPVREVYFVSAGPAATALADGLTGDLRPAGITVRNLAACYEANATGSCVLDLENEFRIVGFDLPATADSTASLARLTRLDSLLDVSRLAERKVVVVAGRIPVARADVAGGPNRAPADTGAKPTPSAPATRTMAERADSVWRHVLAQPALVRILAASPENAAAGHPNVTLTPALGTLAGSSPFSALRGAQRVRLAEGSVETDTLSYQPGFTAPRPEPPHRGWLARWLGWLWRKGPGWLWGLAPFASDLARATVVFLALVFAFLTVARLWDVPKPETPETIPSPDTNNPLNTLLSGNLGRLVLAGLTGIAAVTLITNEFWAASGLSAAAYYIIWFTFLFLLLLVFTALLRAVIEMLRSRVVAARVVPTWELPPRMDDTADAYTKRVRAERRRYWRRRFWSWLLSLREMVLVGKGTFASVLFGRSYESNIVWQNKIVDYQRSLLRTADRVREEIGTAVRTAIANQTYSAPHLTDDRDLPLLEQGVRVAISLLSDTKDSVFYIAAAPGSLSKEFGKTSVAWVSIASGDPLWWEHGYQGLGDIVLYKNVAPPIVEAPGEIRLKDYFQPRQRPDYSAFVVIPLPWRRRDLPTAVRRGAIHISFLKPEWMTMLWPGMAADAGSSPPDDGNSPPDGHGAGPISRPCYENGHLLLADRAHEEFGLADDALRAVLNESVNVLGELISQFDQAIWEHRIRDKPTG